MAERFDAIVIGAGAAGLFCAWEAGLRGKRVLVLDHAKRIGEKIRISGGGRCNFTNVHTAPTNFVSENPKFCISALRSFSPKDFIARVETANISWHEKKLGQLFCDDSAQQIIDMLVEGVRGTGGTLRAESEVSAIVKTESGFAVSSSTGGAEAENLIIATGGKSIPKIGATGFGYKIAEQFGLSIVETRAGLVPLTFEGESKDMATSLAGLSVDAQVSVDPEPPYGARKKKKRTSFQDGFLFTHRGLSGPSILQISNFWRETAELIVDFLPSASAFDQLRERRSRGGATAFSTALAEMLPRRLALSLCESEGWSGNLADWSDKRLLQVAEKLHSWRTLPAGSEGYRTAEVTLGGVDTNDLNSRTMEANAVPGLFFIGEVVDVTGWLGGYNFQWAWASGFAAAKAL